MNNLNKTFNDFRTKILNECEKIVFNQLHNYSYTSDYTNVKELSCKNLYSMVDFKNKKLRNERIMNFNLIDENAYYMADSQMINILKFINDDASKLDFSSITNNDNNSQNTKNDYKNKAKMLNEIDDNKKKEYKKNKFF